MKIAIGDDVVAVEEAMRDAIDEDDDEDDYDDEDDDFIEVDE